MPEAFDRCVKGNGRVRTVSGHSPEGKKMGLKADEYIHICFDKSGAHPGYKKVSASEAIKESD